MFVASHSRIRSAFSQVRRVAVVGLAVSLLSCGVGSSTTKAQGIGTPGLPPSITPPWDGPVPGSPAPQGGGPGAGSPTAPGGIIPDPPSDPFNPMQPAL